MKCYIESISCSIILLMFDILSTREFAHISLFAFVFFYSLAKSEGVRKSTKKLILLVFEPAAFLIFDLFALFEVIVLLFVSNLNFWEPVYYKDFIFWLVLGGFPALFQDMRISKEGFRKMIWKHFIWSTVVEFITGLITFSLFTEYLICIFGTFMVLFNYHAEANGHPWRLGQAIMGIFVLTLMGATIYKGIASFNEYGNKETLIKLLIPLGFYCSSIPYLYLFYLFSRYQELFVIISMLEKRNMSPPNRKRDALSWCRGNLDKLSAFRRLYPRNPYFTKDEFLLVCNKTLTVEELIDRWIGD